MTNCIRGRSDRKVENLHVLEAEVKEPPPPAFASPMSFQTFQKAWGFGNKVGAMADSCVLGVVLICSRHSVSAFEDKTLEWQIPNPCLACICLLQASCQWTNGMDSGCRHTISCLFSHLPAWEPNREWTSTAYFVFTGSDLLCSSQLALLLCLSLF